MLKNLFNSIIGEEMTSSDEESFHDAAQPDPKDLSRLPFATTSAVISNVFTHLKSERHSPNVALEARVGATIWLLTYYDKTVARDYSQCMYPHIRHDDIPGLIHVPQPSDASSLKFFHWLRLLGQRALKDKKLGFDGNVILDDINGTQKPRWQSVKEAQATYEPSGSDEALMYAQGYMPSSDEWHLSKDYCLPGESKGCIYELQAGNILFKFSDLVRWCNEFEKLANSIEDVPDEDEDWTCEKSVVSEMIRSETRQKLTSLDKIIPLSTWKLDKEVDMGVLNQNIWCRNSGASFHPRHLNNMFLGYCRMYAEACLSVKYEDAARMFENRRILLFADKTHYFSVEDKAYAILELCLDAARFNRQQDQSKWMKEAAQMFLNGGMVSSNADQLVILPALLVAIVWQQGNIELKGTLHSLSLHRAFELALKKEFNEGDEEEHYCIKDGMLKTTFGDFKLEDMRRTIQRALNHLKFESTIAIRHPSTNLTRSASCGQLLFRPEGGATLAETKTDLAYMPVKGLAHR